MNSAEIFASLSQKGADREEIAAEVLKRPETIPDLLEGLNAKKANIKYGSEKVLRRISEERPEQIFDRYFAPIGGPVMVTAANIIGSAAKIAKAKPALTEKIVTEILKVQKAKYLMHGGLSPECNNVICGHAVDTFTEIYDQIHDKKRVRDFVGRQLRSSRPAVRKKAEIFFKMHNETRDG